MKALFTRRSGEGVASWVPFAAIVGVMALILALISVNPTQARAEDSVNDQLSQINEQLSELSDIDPQETATDQLNETVENNSETDELIDTEALTADIAPFAANSNVVITVDSIRKQGDTSAEGNKLTVEDTVLVKGKWDASSGGTDVPPVEGDTFFIGFPDELDLNGPISFDLKASDGVALATCVADAGSRQIICTITAAGANEEEYNPAGTWEVYATVIQETTSETLEFSANGVLDPVTLPGGGGIDPKPDEQRYTQKAGAMQNDAKTAKWTVTIPGSELQGTGPFVFIDTLPIADPANENAGEMVFIADSQAINDGEVTAVDNGDGTVTFSVTPPAGGFVAADDYVLSYNTKVEGDLADPNGTTYTNQISGPGVLPGGGTATVTQSWNKADFDKGGSISLGTSAELDERSATITWKVIIPGSKLSAASNTFADSLIAHPDGTTAHSYATELGFQVFERIHRDVEGGSTGWGSALPGIFPEPTVSPDRKSFTTTSTYDFREDAQYRIIYKSTPDKPGLPDDKSVFRNVASVNGEDKPAAVQYNGKTGAKSGNLITGEEDPVNGVQLERNTALSWTVTVPGHQIENNDSLVLNDIIDENQKLCEGSGTTAERLGLTVVAKDQVDGGQLPEINLTPTASASEVGGLTITVPKPEDGFNREYKYEIKYVTCTASGGDDSGSGITYTNKVNYEGGTAEGKVSSAQGGSGTGGIANRGSFTLTKGKTSESVSFPSDLEFTVRVEEYAPGKVAGVDAPTSTYPLQIKADGTPVKGQFVRGTGWTIRLTEVNVPTNLDGIEFGAPQFVSSDGVAVSDDGTSAIVTVTPRANVAVQLNNTAKKGEVSLTKEVVGDAKADAAGTRFEVKAIINGSDVRTLYLTDGKTVTIEDLPIGAEVEFEEVKPVDTDDVTWGTPVFDPAKIIVGETASVKLTNTADASKGTFNLKKVVEGTEANNPNLPQNYEVVAKWDGGQKELTLPANGTVVEFDQQLPTGTVVTLSENLTAADNLEWGTPVFSGSGVSINDNGESVVTIGRGNAELTLTNTVTPVGTLNLKKTVGGEAAAVIPQDAAFKVKAEWKKPGDADYTSKTLEVLANGTEIGLGLDLPVGTEVRFSEIELPVVAGIEWGTPAWGTDPTGEQWLTVSNGVATGIVSDKPKEGRLISLTNTAEYAERPVTITKKLVGEAAGNVSDELTYTVNATFSTGEVKQFTIKNGETAQVGSYPVGTEIVFSEVQPTNTDQVTWGQPQFAPSNTIVVGADQLNVAVELTNTANQTFGTFSISKTVDGPERFNPNVPDSFKVIAKWDGGEKELTVPSDGSVVEFGQNLPSGTKITLAEVLPEDGNGLAWTEATFEPGREITIGLDPVRVSLKNFVDKNDGTLRIVKGVEGEASSAVNSDQEFKVKAEWKKPGSTSTEYESKELVLKNNQTAVELGVDLPVGTEVKFTEIGFPEIDGVEWGTPAWDTNPAGESWLTVDSNGVATGIVSDSPTEGRLIKLNNTANWKLGELKIEKKIVENGEILSVGDSSIDVNSEFEVRITEIDPQVADDVNFPKVGQSVKLNKDNNWTWESGKVLPKGTKVSFEEVNLVNQPGLDWAKPYYVVGTDDEGAYIYDNTAAITGEDKTNTVEVHNRPVPTTEVDIDKIVTGPKGNEVENDASSTFQITATWKDADDQDRTCVLNVTPRGNAIPTSSCDATVRDGKVYFPANTEIIFTESGAFTDVPNVKWGEIIWSITSGTAEADASEEDPKSAVVTITGDERVVIGLENKTSSNGLIIIPIPIPIPEWPGFPGSSTPVDPGTPPTPTTPVTPGEPGKPVTPVKEAEHGKATPGKSTPAKGGLANTGANVAWLAGGGILLLAGGIWFATRGRKNES